MKQDPKLTKKTAKSSNQSSRLRRFLDHALTILLFIFLAFFAYLTGAKYWPRPLASDFIYVGREYDSGCIVPFVWSFVCMAPGHENYFYTTDVPPEEFANRFEGWSGEVEQSDARGLVEPLSIRLDNASVGLNSYGNGGAYVEYVKDQTKKRRDFLLMPITKKYLVEVSRENRSQLIK